MSRKIVRVLGKRGRITIPYEIRVRNKIGYNDILSFEEKDKNTIIVRKEKLCSGCTPECFDEENSIPIEDFIDSLRAAFDVPNAALSIAERFGAVESNGSAPSMRKTQNHAIPTTTARNESMTASYQW